MEALLLRQLRLAAQKASDLCRVLRISQPTLHRLLKRLERERKILQVGNARRTQYAAIRHHSALRTAKQPIYTIDKKGRAEKIATITSVYPNHFAVKPERNKKSGTPFVQAEILPSLPFYLQGLRPEGYLGRLLTARLKPVLDMPSDLRDGSEDDVLAFAAVFGSDMPGAFIVGEDALRKYLEKQDVAVEARTPEALQIAATQFETGERIGSSAGGEQPKFAAYLRVLKKGAPLHAIVKFSPEKKNSVSVRWVDLLVSEHIALEVLRSENIPVSTTHLLSTQQRIFLVVERFDRVGPKGRQNYFSFGALDDAFHGDRLFVRKAAQYFFENKLITKKDHTALLLMSLFGDRIGNTDQHFGNISFTTKGNRFQLAPAYDILPMWYAPRSQGVLPQGLHPLPTILPEYEEFKKKVQRMAIIFWQRVSESPLVSRGFLKIAKQNRERIEE